MSQSFKLDYDIDGQPDLAFVNGQIGFITGRDYVRQRLTTRLQMFLGEWFLNINDGVPWFEKVFVKPVNLVTVEGIIKSTILNTPDVTGLTEFNSTYDRFKRSYSVSFRCETIYGSLSMDFING